MQARRDQSPLSLENAFFSLQNKSRINFARFLGLLTSNINYTHFLSERGLFCIYGYKNFLDSKSTIIGYTELAK